MATPILLELDLSRGLLDSPPEQPLAAWRARDTPVLSRAVRRLREAARSSSVGGLVALLGEGGLSHAQAEELGAAVEAFGDAGKPTVCFATAYGENSNGTAAYLLASHFDQVWVQPSGGVGLLGVALTGQFAREALDRLGLEPQVRARHEYKNAPDTALRSSMSQAQRESYQRLADSLVEQLCATVARRRDLEPDAVRSAVEQAPLTAADAQRLGLVDHLGYRDQAYAAVREAIGGSADTAVELRYLHRWSPPTAQQVGAQLRRELPRRVARTLVRAGGRRRPSTVAVVGVEGGIVTGRGGGSPLGGANVGSDRVCSALRQAGADDDVAAVVLRVVSPGGSYTASDAVHREVGRLTAAGTPVVASMGSVAASGGYFVAMGADEVLALPGTLTGSIGVFAGKLVLTRALESVGVRSETVQTGPQAAMWSSLHRFDDAQLARLDAWLDEVYADFVAKAAAGRGMDADALEPLARGRVWTGADALEHGLVDRLGGLEEAVSRAAALAGRAREDVRAVRYPDVPPLARLVPATSSESPHASLRLSLPGDGLAGIAELAASPERLLAELAAATGLSAGLTGGALRAY